MALLISPVDQYDSFLARDEQCELFPQTSYSLDEALQFDISKFHCDQPSCNFLPTAGINLLCFWKLEVQSAMLGRSTIQWPKTTFSNYASSFRVLCISTSQSNCEPFGLRDQRRLSQASAPTLALLYCSSAPRQWENPLKEGASPEAGQSLRCSLQTSSSASRYICGALQVTNMQRFLNKRHVVGMNIFVPQKPIRREI